MKRSESKQSVFYIFIHFISINQSYFICIALFIHGSLTKKNKKKDSIKTGNEETPEVEI